MDQVKALGETELKGRKQQQRSSSRKPAVHLLRSDPCSWEKQHKRQHGFSLSSTGLFTQADKGSWRAERDAQRI